MFGFRLRRSPEDQKAFEEKVERAAYESTVNLLRWLKIDRFCAWLQERSAEHPKVWLGALSGLMVLMFVALVAMPTVSVREQEAPLQVALEQIKAARQAVGNLNVFADSTKVNKIDTMLNSDTGAGIKPYPPMGTPAKDYGED